MKTRLAEWLSKRIDASGLSYREIEHKSHVSIAVFSRIM